MAILNIPITKAGNKPIAIDTETDLPDAMYELALREGLKVLLNARMTKITTKGLEGDDLLEAQSAAMKVAEANAEKVRSGTYTKGRAAATTDASGQKVPGVVMTEAMRLAKAKVKDILRANKIRISTVEASQITAAAKELVAADPSYIEQAKANIEARAAKPVAVDLSAFLKESPKLVAAAEAKRKERKTTLSAKQAGMTAKVPPKKPTIHAH